MKKNFKRIIDFGCGKGTLAKKIKNKKNLITAVDISKEAIKLAKQKNKNKIEFSVIKKNQSIKNLLKIEKKIDLIICVEVLSYIKKWKKYIAEFSKIANNLYVALSLPYRPIGYVKNFA
jgi:2-polyprenyl-3-methyl-5-hydroxy-6-metoxy-1,4-benzoquinol methylase